jgi:hypothetical protein
MRWEDLRDWQDEVPDKQLGGCVVIEHKAPPAAPVQRGEWRRFKEGRTTRVIRALKSAAGRQRLIVPAFLVIGISAAAIAAALWLLQEPAPPPAATTSQPEVIPTVTAPLVLDLQPTWQAAPGNGVRVRADDQTRPSRRSHSNDRVAK